MSTTSKTLLAATVLLLIPAVAAAHPGHGESALMHAIEHIAIGGLIVGLTGGLLVALIQRLRKRHA
jgi:hypothetical protein